jgi:putative endonuclease
MPGRDPYPEATEGI